MNLSTEYIRKEIPPEKFGLRKWLLQDLYITPPDSIFPDHICVKKQTGSFKEGYDCLDAALKLKEILDNHGIRSDIYSGKDEMGIWKTHYFVMTNKGYIIDAVPLYRIVGAHHEPLMKPSNESIEKLKPIIVLNGQVPLSYRNVTKTTKLLSKICIVRSSDVKNIISRVYAKDPISSLSIIETFLIEDGIPKQAYEVLSVFDERALHNKLKKSDLVPSNMSSREKMEMFERLLDDNTIKLHRRVHELKLSAPRELELKEINKDQAKPDLVEEVEKEMEVLAHLDLSTPYARYL